MAVKLSDFTGFPASPHPPGHVSGPPSEYRRRKEKLVTIWPLAGEFLGNAFHAMSLFLTSEQQAAR
jgi:hypothetical protein